jgi:hypothetical protein
MKVTTKRLVKVTMTKSLNEKTPANEYLGRTNNEDNMNSYVMQ